CARPGRDALSRTRASNTWRRRTPFRGCRPNGASMAGLKPSTGSPCSPLHARKAARDSRSLAFGNRPSARPGPRFVQEPTSRRNQNARSLRPSLLHRGRCASAPDPNEGRAGKSRRDPLAPCKTTDRPCRPESQAAEPRGAGAENAGGRRESARAGSAAGGGGKRAGGEIGGKTGGKEGGGK